MKSVGQSREPGNINMKGKKTKHLSCGCCVAQNFKEKVAEEQAIKEIKEYSTDT